MTSCPGITPKGGRCKAGIRDGAIWCRWHDPSAAARLDHKALSRRGGIKKAYGALAVSEPLRETVVGLDLNTAHGLSHFLAATLHKLGELPFDTRVAHAISAICNAQRATVELANIERRIQDLEALQNRRRE